jgi:hypothetical protein
MANAYNRGKQWLMENDLLAVGTTGDVFMLLVNATYVYNASTHDTYSDVTGEIVTSGYTAGGIALTGVAVAENDGSNISEASANRAAFGSLGVGETVHAGIIYENIAAGAPAAGDFLVCFIELPNTATNGQAFSVDFSGNNPGIFLTYGD